MTIFKFKFDIEKFKKSFTNLLFEKIFYEKIRNFDIMQFSQYNSNTNSLIRKKKKNIKKCNFYVNVMTNFVFLLVFECEKKLLFVQ